MKLLIHLCKLRAALAGIFLIALFSSAAQAQVSVQFRIFDEAGKELTYAAVVKRMTNNVGSSAMSTGIMDIDTLAAISLGDEYNSSGKFTVDFPAASAAHPKPGLMIHWNTANTGYSSFLLDNGGKGFSQKATLIFNEQLAYDARRQFNDAYARRLSANPPYAPSSSFSSLGTAIDGCFIRLGSAATPSLKGRIGQECVDKLAQAMALLLREYGMANARNLETVATQNGLGLYGRWGVSTADNIDADPEPAIDDLAALFEPRHRWARIIMTETSEAYYAKVRKWVNYASGKQVQTLGQLFDSSVQKSLTLAQFKSAVDRALIFPDFSKITAWEVGNEVNGGWLGSNMSAKIDYAASQVKSKTGKPVCLTFYWYGTEDTLKTSLFNWIYTNITPNIKNNLDCVTLSIYTDQQPLGFSWDLVMAKLGSLFPGKQLMVGELGFVDPSVKPYFREGPLTLTLEQGGKLYIQNRYPASFATANSYGGSFWWYYDDEMIGRKPLWGTLHDVYCSVYKGYADVSHVCP
ncbi:hypothetical protein [Polaromonas sp.]|uniref:hypothetical protein n=1 Tax=Polaromonas sp. TaxID=1869339 RepID=UPI003BB59F8B